MNCFKCKNKCERTKIRKTYFGKIEVSNVNVFKCKKCGSEVLDEEEYEKIRKNVHAALTLEKTAIIK